MIVLRSVGALSIASWALLIVLIGGFFGYRALTRETPTMVEITYGDVLQQISVTGKARPVQEVDLGFHIGGTIERVHVAVSDHVEAGEQLAALSTSELAAQLRQAEANRDAAYAELLELKRGARPEDISVKEAEVASAASALREAERVLQNALRAAYTSADDALRTRADQFMSNVPWNPTLIVSPSNSGLKLASETQRLQLSQILDTWAASVTELKSHPDTTDATISNLHTIQAYLTTLSQAVSSLSSTNGMSQTTLEAYKNDLVAARSAVDGAIAAVQTARSVFAAADVAYAVAQRSLEATKAGATSEALLAQESRVRQFEAQVESIEAQISRAHIIAPISGVVTRQEAKVGQVAVQGAPLISVMSDAHLEIEAYVPEINIGKVAVGNDARITFDAFPGETFTGTVVAIDPAETVISGVANFKVTVGLSRPDTRLRSGLTADLTIIRAERARAIVVPSYALEIHEGAAEVERVRAGVREKVRILTGISGENGYTEVLDGLLVGDSVVLPF